MSLSPITTPAVFDAAHRQVMLDVARASIMHGLDHGASLQPDPRDYLEQLRLIRATFVTLEIAGELRGCIGVLDAFRPLVLDVAMNAYAAAFEDPRFPPLSRAEFRQLDVTISVLSPSESIAFSSEADLLTKIRPGVDGLIIKERGRRGTFLPSVWDQLADPKDFLEHLKRKAGLPFGYWSDDLQVDRYTAESFRAATAS
jgi:uncharacterized protein